MSKKRSLSKVILMSLGCCCLLAAATLALLNSWTESQAKAEADQLTASLASMLAESATNSIDGVDSGLENNTTGEISSLDIGGYDVCGALSIPAIDIELAVISTWSYPKLNISACRYSGSPEGQLIIMAHNYAQHFGKLNELSAGDDVVFTDIEGIAHNYRVSATETWATNQLQEILSGEDWALTLFTCTYGGANRVVVRCTRV